METNHCLEVAATGSVTFRVVPLALTPIFCAAVGAMDAVERLMVRLAPLAAPVTAGLLLITRIRYPVPVAVLAGIVAEMVPVLDILFIEPMFVGLAKEPAELDNCAI